MVRTTIIEPLQAFLRDYPSAHSRMVRHGDDHEARFEVIPGGAECLVLRVVPAGFCAAFCGCDGSGPTIEVALSDLAKKSSLAASAVRELMRRAPEVAGDGQIPGSYIRDGRFMWRAPFDSRSD